MTKLITALLISIFLVAFAVLLVKADELPLPPYPGLQECVVVSVPYPGVQGWTLDCVMPTVQPVDNEDIDVDPTPTPETLRIRSRFRR